MRKVSKLTEKTAEIKSSDGIQLGDVELIVENEIVMDCYIGKRARFILPKDMIGRIRRKTVHLNLTKEEFEDWWKKEGLLHAAELPARLEVISGRKLVGEDLMLLKDQIKTAFNKIFPLDLADDKREKLLMEQEEFRQSFSSKVRKILHKDEWIYYLLNLYEGRPSYLSMEDDVFLVTSKRLIRYKSDGTGEDNWAIYLDGITEAATYKEWRYPVPGAGPGRYTWVLGRKRGRRQYKVLRFGYRKNGNLRHRELSIPIGKPYWYVSPSKYEHIEKNVEKFIDLPFIEDRPFNWKRFVGAVVFIFAAILIAILYYSFL